LLVTDVVPLVLFIVPAFAPVLSSTVFCAVVGSVVFVVVLVVFDVVTVAASLESGAPDVTVPGVSVSGFTPVDVSPVDAQPHMAIQRIERAI
jgi:hypothetical protein